MNAYLNSLNVDFEEKRRMRTYLNVVKWRADGTLQTFSSWMRNFIRRHPAYNNDSVVTEEINYDLMVAIDEM